MKMMINLESMLKQLNALIANKQYKNIKTVIADTKKAIKNFEDKVNVLDSDLYNLVKPEEDARHSILKLKENYRRVKQTFYQYADVDLVASSINQVFDKLDQKFIEFETRIESLNTKKLKHFCQSSIKVVSALESALSQLPNLCVLVNVVPDKIAQLKKEYANVESQGLPLYNLQFQNKLNEWERDLEVIKSRLTKLNLTNIMEGLDALQS